MRISFLMWQFGTLPESFPKGALGGAESAVWHLSKELSKRHEISILCMGKAYSSSKIDGITLVRIPPATRWKWVAGDSYYARAVRAARTADVIESITCMEPALFTDKAALHMENELHPSLPFPKPKAKMYLKKLGNLRCVSGVSRYVTKGFLRRFGYQGRTATVMNGADCQFFTPRKRDRSLLAEKYSLSEDDVVVVYAAAIHRRKGLHLLLDAMEKTSNRDVRLLVAGGLIYSKKRPEDARYLDRQLERMRSMENVSFIGPLNKEDLSSLLASADIFACPSIWNDPCPLVCAEAQASGTPVVGFSRGGIPELVEHGETGIICRAHPQPLAEAIGKLSEDRALRRRMGRRARERAVTYLSWQRIASQLERLLESSFL